MVSLGNRRSQLMINMLIYLILIILVLILMIPYIWMVSTAMKSLAQASRWPPSLIPNPIVWENFSNALFTWLPFHIFFRNTILVGIFVVVGEVLSCSFVAYGFARLRFPGRDILFAIVLSTMMVPFVVRLVPLFLLYRNLGWINTLYPLIVPAFFAGTPFFIFLLRQFYRTIPDELSDAARIDGASDYQIWWRLIVPLSKPALAAIAIFAFQDVWNDFLGPLVFLRDTNVKTVMLGIYSLVGMVPEWPPVMAAVTVVTLPMLLIFFFFQRFFIEGITVTGMKG
jgi:multiple sugar transport system permease protein